jgi:hypothetical protein
MTAHWIAEEPGMKMLKMCSALLAFHCICGHHTGAITRANYSLPLRSGKGYSKGKPDHLISSTQLTHALSTHRLDILLWTM